MLPCGVPASPAKHVRVLVIGAGAAGLSAASYLLGAGLSAQDLLVLEARNRAGGRVFTRKMGSVSPPTFTGKACPNSTESLGEITVDVGASYMHGCADDNQVVFQRAIEEKIIAPVVAGGAAYECTQHARWFHNDEEISTELIVEMHNLFWTIGRCLSTIASVNDDHTANLETYFAFAKEYVLHNLGNRVLSHVEECVLRKIALRSYGYCSPLSKMALLQASIGADPNEDAVIGPLASRDEDFGLVSAAANFEPHYLKTETIQLKRRIRNSEFPNLCIASRRNPFGDRLVVEGYTPFLIDKLKVGLPIQFESVVHKIEYGTPGRQDNYPTPLGSSDSDNAKAGVKVYTRAGEIYTADFIVVTLPIGVLKARCIENTVIFEPPLSEEKLSAIQSMGMGVHNKVILRFRPQDVFWPPGTPQLNCLDPRFQFCNLHAYGKPGVLLAHVFGGTGFASGYNGLSDEEVIQEVLTVLEDMFFPRRNSAQIISRKPNEQKSAYVTEEIESGSLSSDTHPPGKVQRSHLANEDEGLHLKHRASMRDSTFREIVEDEGALDFCSNNSARAVNQARDISSRPRNDDADQHVPVIRSSKEDKNQVRCDEILEEEGGVRNDNCKEKVLNDFKNVKNYSLRLRNKTLASPDLEARKPRRSRLEKTRYNRKRQIPKPVETIVTRWDQDPFSQGSYSFLPVGANWDMIAELATPEPRDTEIPRLFFAGEHCNDLGWQCVHGACESGADAARSIMRLLPVDIFQHNASQRNMGNIPARKRVKQLHT